ncbi:FAD-linked oxidoreductase [Hyphodiscus hymeniophilus]|uniref:FAD-linked oxidoreductase n=1 Tax=Hyphodiscus hymeniophilus TaxID=353542 RepID=A0A9P6VEG5_9HELO|nr:FAD-linked oxidoreductase [Hyphodiscus hymeniophilus]
MKAFFLALVSGVLSGAAAASTAGNITALFEPSLSPGAAIYYKTDPNWTNEVTQRWTFYEAPVYYAAIKPATVTDVQAIIKIAVKNKINFMTTGAGHSNTVSAQGLDGVQIDMSGFNTTVYDATSKTVTIGGGGCVGMVGATLGGGVGRLQGLHGLIIDALLSVEIVTPNGQLITASKSQNAELFWGLRGAGMNFGIIVSATYETYPATNGGKFTNADFIFRASSNASHWAILQSFNRNMPAALSFTMNIGFNATFNEPLILMNAIYAGPQAEAEKILAPFINNNPIQSNISMIPYTSVNSAPLFGKGDSPICQGTGADNLPLNNYALGLKQIDSDTFTNWFADVADFYHANPGLQTISLTIQRLATQAVLAVPDISTAYGHREIIAHLIFINGYNVANATLTATLTTYMKQTIDAFQATSGFAEKSMYVNYAHGDEGAAAWYSSRKLPFLMALKEKWDPQRLFSWTNPIPEY